MSAGPRVVITSDLFRELMALAPTGDLNKPLTLSVELCCIICPLLFVLRTQMTHESCSLSREGY